MVYSSQQITCLHVDFCKDGVYMQLTQSASMRMEHRQLLTPRMIQSMEILQLPLMALEERIEQEIQNNPVLEFREPENEPGTPENPENGEARQEYSEGEQALVVPAELAERLPRAARYVGRNLGWVACWTRPGSS